MGSAVRSYTYVTDMVDGIHMLTQSDLEGAVNIGCPQYVTVADLVATVAEVAGKRINSKHIDGPVGVHSRNPSTGSGHRFSKARTHSLGLQAKVSLKARPEPFGKLRINSVEGRGSRARIPGSRSR